MPLGIVDHDFADLPGAGPVLDIVLSLDRGLNVVKLFKIDEAFQSVAFCETIDKAGAMFEDSAHKIICDANVKNSVGLVSQYVDITAIRHTIIMKGVDGRDKPGHDGAYQ